MERDLPLGVFCIVLLCVLVACFGVLIANEMNSITSGIIVAKDYNPVTIRMYRLGPPQYQFCIEGEKDGEIVKYWFDVTPEEYGKYNVGDPYPR